MRRPPSLLLALGLLQVAGTAWALKIQTLDLKRHHRFYEGDDKVFVGDPYDWSGVARTWDVGKWGAMVSPSYFVSANHFHPAVGETFRFYHGNTTNTTYEERTVISGQKILGEAGANSDLWLGKLSDPVSGAVAKYPILRLPNSLTDYPGKTVHVFGRPTDNNQATNSQTRLHMGLSKISSVQADSGGSYFSWYSTGSPFGGDSAQYAEGGDSGGSSFIVFNGVPTLLGTHYYPNLSSFTPDYIAQFNEAMSGSGEQVTVITLDTTPALPQDFAVVFAVGSGALVTWTDIADTETGYALERRTAGGAFEPLQTLPADAESYADGSAVPSVSYEYRLRAFNTAGSSEWVTDALSRQSHALPYRESFEGFADGFLLPGFEGWRGEDALARASADSPALAGLQAYAAVVGYPLRAEAHAQVAVVEGAVTNALAAPSGTAVWCDLMAEITRAGGALPPPAADLQCALSLDADGRLNVWHRDLDGGTNRWSALAWQTAQTAVWARVTLHLDYATHDAAHDARYFRLYVDGAEQGHALAYTANDGTGAPGGTWFALSATAPDGIDALFIDGVGTLDDLVVDTARPLIGVGPLGTPEWWLADHGLTNALSLAENELEDADDDGFPNWKEHGAETDPNDPGSLLRVTDLPILANGRLALAVQTVPGRRYALEGSVDLATDAWEPAAFALAPDGEPAVQTATATAGTLTLHVETAAPFRVYRVRVEPAGNP